MNRTSVLLAALLTVIAAMPALADRYLLIAASKSVAFAADIDRRTDLPNGHVLFEVEQENLDFSRARYLLIGLEADCAKGTLNLAQTHAMHSPNIEAGMPWKPLPEWKTPKVGSTDAGFLAAGCAPTFPAKAVVDLGEGNHDFALVLDAAIKAQLGLKPTDPFPKVRR